MLSTSYVGLHTGAGERASAQRLVSRTVPSEPPTYAAAGVDIDAGERAVALMQASVARASRPEVLGGLGGFAGLFDASALREYRHPLLATSTDGVGTKVVVAQRMGKHDTIGQDLVGMLVDDLVVCGAEPLFVTDYIACGRVVPERIAAIVAGVAEGCRLAGAALVGGETAEHPGLLDPDEYDIAGATTGVVEADRLLGPHRVVAGDAVLALASSGLHSNGYSLARRVFFDHAGWDVHRHVDELGRMLGEELLEPTRIYALDCLALAAGLDVHAMAHITGGGLAANLARVLPAGLGATLERATWSPSAVFRLLVGLGVAQPEMDRTFNMGVGMAVVLPESEVGPALDLLDTRGVPAWWLGQVDDTDGVRLVGSHP
jgi:phosphoribosylformylglycinamidine cyclo-ligase